MGFPAGLNHVSLPLTGFAETKGWALAPAIVGMNGDVSRDS
jgi:hypothetical protein